MPATASNRSATHADIFGCGVGKGIGGATGEGRTIGPELAGVGLGVANAAIGTGALVETGSWVAVGEQTGSISVLME